MYIEEHLGTWKDKLQEISSSLSGIITSREDKFLEIGSAVQGFAAQAREISGLASEGAEIALGESFSGAVEQFQAGFQEMLELAAKFNLQSSLERISSLMQSIISLGHELEGFKPIEKRLKVLSIITRIESARLGTEGKGFGTLADDVERLSARTVDYTAQIKEKKNQLQNIVEKTRETMQGLTRGRGDSRSLIKELEPALQELEKFKQNSEDFSKEISDRTDKVAENIGEIVSSLQFHDIIRQQVEHVSEVIQESEGFIDEYSHGDLTEEQEEEIVSWLADVCALQESQLEYSKNEFNTAVEQIWHGLQGIVSEVNALHYDTRRMSGSGQKQGSSVLSRIGQEIENVLKPMKNAAEELILVKEQISSIADLIEDMGEFVGYVQEVKDEIELIALNASVKSAHTGERGKALGVLAEAIRKLSMESGEHTAKVSEALSKISENSELFKGEADSAKEYTGQQESLIESLEGIVLTLQKSNADLQGKFQEVEDNCGNLGSQIENLLQDKNFQEEVKRRLSEYKEDLREIKDRCKEMIPEGQIYERSDRLKKILEKYTMESERLVHLAYSGLDSEESQDQEASTEVELFDSEEEDDQGLGDNVELF